MKPVTVRVVDYEISTDDEHCEQYRLMTTLLDPEYASVDELASAYHRRWEIENTFDELKTHQSGPRMVLRWKFTGPGVLYKSPAGSPEIYRPEFFSP